MANCGVMRIEKRGRSAVFGVQIEANRTQEDHERGRDFDKSDIDWTRTADNIHLIKTDNWNKEITRQIHAAGLTERKDSVVLLDGLFTASAEWFSQHTKEEAGAYFKDCLDFYVKEFCGGDRSRVLNAVIHLDETTPHLQVASVPIIEDEKGKHLSAKVVCGGRSDFRKRQDRFFEQVTQKRGLERGEVKDAAEVKAHTTKREWQAAKQAEELAAQEAQKAANRAELADIRQQTTDAQNALVEARSKAEAEAEKAAAIAKHNAEHAKVPFSKRGDTMSYHQNMLDAVKQSARDVGEMLQDFTKRTDATAKDREAAKQARAEAEGLKAAEEQLIRRLAREEFDRLSARSRDDWAAAKQARNKAEELLQHRKEHIKQAAERMVSERLVHAEDFLQSITFKDGRTALEVFEEEERSRDDWERF